MNIAILGGLGKMGQASAEYASSKGHNVLLVDLKSEIKFLKDLEIKPDCILDFSIEEGTKSAIDYCMENKIPLVSGTTGLKKDIFIYAKEKIPILHSPNFSLGINLLFLFLKSFPERLVGFFDTFILESHHSAKKDKPSGTAKKISNIINPVDVFSIRAKDDPGTHFIFLHGEGETIEIIHRARTRKIFALGAILACEWIIGKAPGLYSMEDIWNLKR